MGGPAAPHRSPITLDRHARRAAAAVALAAGASLATPAPSPNPTKAPTTRPVAAAAPVRSRPRRLFPTRREEHWFERRVHAAAASADRRISRSPRAARLHGSTDHPNVRRAWEHCLPAMLRQPPIQSRVPPFVELERTRNEPDVSHPALAAAGGRFRCGGGPHGPDRPAHGGKGRTPRPLSRGQALSPPGPGQFLRPGGAGPRRGGVPRQGRTRLAVLRHGQRDQADLPRRPRPARLQPGLPVADVRAADDAGPARDHRARRPLRGPALPRRGHARIPSAAAGSTCTPTGRSTRCCRSPGAST